MSSNVDLICETGEVRRLAGGKAFVWVEPPAGCGGCASRDFCGAIASGGRLLEVRNDAGASVGQRVELGVRPAAVLTASFLLFIVPAAAFVAGIVAGYLLADQFGWQGRQWIGLAVGAAAFVATMLGIRLLSPRLERSGKYEPMITRILV